MPLGTDARAVLAASPRATAIGNPLYGDTGVDVTGGIAQHQDVVEAAPNGSAPRGAEIRPATSADADAIRVLDAVPATARVMH